eukprot:756244-Hanusia_phi.AAC.1
MGDQSTRRVSSVATRRGGRAGAPAQGTTSYSSSSSTSTSSTSTPPPPPSPPPPPPPDPAPAGVARFSQVSARSPCFQGMLCISFLVSSELLGRSSSLIASSTSSPTSSSSLSNASCSSVRGAGGSRDCTLRGER